MINSWASKTELLICCQVVFHTSVNTNNWKKKVTFYLQLNVLPHPQYIMHGYLMYYDNFIYTVS